MPDRAALGLGGAVSLLDGLRSPLFEQRGRLVGALGTTLKVCGVRARIGDLVEVLGDDGGAPLFAEVVGFESEAMVLTPLGEKRTEPRGRSDPARNGRPGARQ